MGLRDYGRASIGDGWGRISSHPMTVRRRVMIASLALCVSACGDDREPPTAPSASPRPLTFAIAGTPVSPGVGESFQLRAVVVHTDGSSTPPRGEITWRSSNEAVLAVWPGGLLVAHAPGDATISASADGQRAETSLRVEPRGATPRRLQGRLTDFASDAPMAGVTLAFGADVAFVDQRTTTDAAGAFAIDVPPGRIYAAIDGQIVADLAVHVGGPAFRGDLLGNGGVCISRYGLITDGATFQPVAGANVRLGGRSIVTGADGWYRIDLGCDVNPIGNFNTTFMYVTHPAYREFSRVLGRGIHRVNRVDAELQRPQ
jgi:hypothetical protein